MQTNPLKFLLNTAVIALLVLAVSTAVIWRLYRGDGSLLRQVSIAASQISPNADGQEDITLIQYQLTRSAVVSIYFEDDTGTRYYFRRERLRGAGDYEVYFSGVVDGYRLPGETIEGEIMARLLPDGRYTWTVQAVDLNNHTEQHTGTLTIANASTQLPELRNFALDKQTFTPNRDGIDDRVLIQYHLQKEAHVRVFLELPDGGEIPIGQTERDVPAGMPGRHYYDYEGGVDNGQTPPPDGVYTVTAVAEDAEGQKIRVSRPLTIALGGVPRADIFSPPSGDQFAVSGTAVPLCGTLFFTLTVENYGTTPIRTTGPAPGTVYDSNWNYNTLGWHTESGAWRVAIGYENELGNYPFRWAVGDESVLEEIDGHLYLMPGQRALVTGGIRMVGPLGERNPQPMWAGLIHEDVEISQFNNRVDPKAILLDLPDPANRQPCAER